MVHPIDIQILTAGTHHIGASQAASQHQAVEQKEAFSEKFKQMEIKERETVQEESESNKARKVGSKEGGYLGSAGGEGRKRRKEKKEEKGKEESDWHDPEKGAIINLVG
ncbi:MAG: hypothetical protein ACUVXI_04885 [bacterium]